MSDLSKRLRQKAADLREWAEVRDMDVDVSQDIADLLAAADDVDRLDKMERQCGPVVMIGTHLQRDGSYRTWQWRNVHGRETLRRRSVRECIDDIKEIL